MEEELIKINGWGNTRRKVKCDTENSRQERKEPTKRCNIFLTGRASWLERYCIFLLFSDECYPRPCTSAFSGEASNKFGLLRTVPRQQYFN